MQAAMTVRSTFDGPADDPEFNHCSLALGPEFYQQDLIAQLKRVNDAESELDDQVDESVMEIAANEINDLSSLMGLLVNEDDRARYEGVEDAEIDDESLIDPNNRSLMTDLERLLADDLPSSSSSANAAATFAAKMAETLLATTEGDEELRAFRDTIVGATLTELPFLLVRVTADHCDSMSITCDLGPVQVMIRFAMHLRSPLKAFPGLGLGDTSTGMRQLKPVTAQDYCVRLCLMWQKTCGLTWADKLQVRLP